MELVLNYWKTRCSLNNETSIVMSLNASENDMLKPMHLFNSITFGEAVSSQVYLLITVEEDYLKYVDSLAALNDRVKSSANLQQEMTPTIPLLGNAQSITDFGLVTHLVLCAQEFKELKEKLIENNVIKAPNLEYIAVVFADAAANNFERKNYSNHSFEILEESANVMFLRLSNPRHTLQNYDEDKKNYNLMKWWKSLMTEQLFVNPMKRSCYYGQLMERFIEKKYYSSIASSLSYEICAALSYHKYAKEKKDGEGFHVYEAYDGASGKKVGGFKCTIMKESGKQWTKIEYIGLGKKCNRDDVVAQVKVVKTYKSYDEIPDIYPTTAIIQETSEKFHVLDLKHPLSYIHDRPEVLDKIYSNAPRVYVNVKSVRGKTHALFKMSERRVLNSGSVVFLLDAHNERNHDKTMAEFRDTGWPWSSFVLYHRGVVSGLCKDFQVVFYPEYTGHDNIWASNTLRLKKDPSKPLLGWGVVTTVNLDKGVDIIPFCGTPHTGAEFEKLSSSGRTDFRSYGFKGPAGRFGIGSMKCGSIARYINHSCNGNVLTFFNFTHGGFVVMRCAKFIEANGFLTYDYGGSKTTDKCMCQTSVNFEHTCDREDESLRSSSATRVSAVPHEPQLLLPAASQEPSGTKRATTAIELEERLKTITVQHEASYKRLGEGTFGTCYEYTNSSTGDTFAMKKFKGSSSNDYLREIAAGEILSGIDYFPKVVAKTVLQGGKRALLFEMVVGRNIRDSADILKEGDWKGTWLTRLDVCIKLCDAVSAMHNKSLLHNDLHSGNIVLGPNLGVSIIDFGKATSLDKSLYSDVLASSTSSRSSYHRCKVDKKYYWKAPESYNSTRFNHFSSDVYAMGFLFVRLLFGKKTHGFLKVYSNGLTLPPHFFKWPNQLNLPKCVVNMIPLIRKCV